MDALLAERESEGLRLRHPRAADHIPGRVMAENLHGRYAGHDYDLGAAAGGRIRPHRRNSRLQQRERSDEAPLKEPVPGVAPGVLLLSEQVAAASKRLRPERGSIATMLLANSATDSSLLISTGIVRWRPDEIVDSWSAKRSASRGGAPPGSSGGRPAPTARKAPRQCRPWRRLPGASSLPELSWLSSARSGAEPRRA